MDRDKERLDWLEEVVDRADQASIESITTRFVQNDGYYTTWTIKRYGMSPVTRNSFREVIDAARRGT